jgi:hypothetical protein
MRTFKDILTESKKTYHFIVRIAGELPENATEKLNTLVERFGKVSVTGPKRAPITETPMDFPRLKNVEVHTWEVEVNYPTTRDVMQEYLASGCDVAKTHINVRVPGDPVELDQQNRKDGDEPYESLLNTEDMGGESAQEAVAGNRVMDLLKELEIARKERTMDPVAGTPVGESSDITEDENTTSPIGS